VPIYRNGIGVTEKKWKSNIFFINFHKNCVVVTARSTVDYTRYTRIVHCRP